MPLKKNNKVLIVVENLPVPFDKRVWKEAVALHNAGYEVTVLCPKRKGYEQGYQLLNGVHIYRHPMPQERNSPIGYLWEYGCALLWEALYSLWIWLRRGFHIIQGCNPPDNIFLIALPFKLFGVKYVFDHHDVNPELYLSKYEREDTLYKIQVWLEKLTFRVSDIVISTNNSYKNIAVRRGGCDPEDVFVVRNGPDLNSFKAVSPNPKLKNGKPYLVGYVGNMSVQEGLDILVDVVERLKKQGRRDIFFMCVGGGPGLATLQRMHREKHLEDMMGFTGRVSDAELLEVLSTSDICVNPDRPCQMNNISTMIKIMEYMALAKPIVQFDLAEGRFSAGEASLYCDSSNRIEDFAKKIVWLLDHPEERERMGKIGRMRIQTELAWEYSVGNLLKAYEKVLSKSRDKPSLEAESVRS